MFGLVLINPGAETSISSKKVFLITDIDNLNLLANITVPIQVLFETEMKGAFIRGLGIRVDPFSAARRPKSEYGIMYSEVNYIAPSNLECRIGKLFAVAYTKHDLIQLAAQDDLMKNFNVVEEDSLFVRQKNKNTCNADKTVEIAEPPRISFKKPRLLFTSETQCEAWKNMLESFDTPDPRQNQSKILSDVSPSILSPGSQKHFEISTIGPEMNHLAGNSEQIQRLSLDSTSMIMGKLVELEVKLDDSVRLLKSLSQQVSWQKGELEALTKKVDESENFSSDKSRNVVQIHDGFVVTKAAYDEAKRCTLVHKAALPLFESLFSKEEKFTMRLKPKDNQNCVDASRLNAIYKTSASFSDLKRLPTENLAVLSEEEQRVVRGAIGHLLNQKRQRIKKNEKPTVNAEDTAAPLE